MHALSFSGSSCGNFHRAPQFGSISSEFRPFRDKVRSEAFEKSTYDVRNPWGIPQGCRNPLSALLESAQNTFQKRTYYPEILNMIVQKGLGYNRGLFEENPQEARKIITKIAQQFGGPQEFSRALDLISKSFGDQYVPDVIMEPLQAAYERVLQKAPAARKAQARTSNNADTGSVFGLPLVA